MPPRPASDQPSPRGAAARRAQLTAASACLVACLGVLSCAPDSGALAATEAANPKDNRATLVRVVAVQHRDVRREIETTAYLESEHQVKVVSKVPGRVTEVLVDEGEPVQKGRLLARLDDREAAAARRQVSAQLEDRRVRAALAALEVEASARREAQARIDRDRTKAEYDRLSAQDAASVARKALQEAKFTLDSAEQALLVSGFNRRKSILDKDAADNSVIEAAARLEETDVRLEEHQILSPLDGVLVGRHVKGGETISAASDLFTVVDLRNLISYLSRPQAELSLTHASKEVVFTADALPGRDFTADVDLVLPVVDRDTGHFKLRMRVRPSDVDELRPGMFVRARILTEDKRRALMVPKSAVLTDGSDAVVFAVRDGRAFRITLNPGLEEQLFVECRNQGDGGLDPGDVVITAGHEDLSDQSRVEVSEG